MFNFVGDVTSNPLYHAVTEPVAYTLYYFLAGASISGCRFGLAFTVISVTVGHRTLQPITIYLRVGMDRLRFSFTPRTFTCSSGEKVSRGTKSLPSLLD